MLKTLRRAEGRWEPSASRNVGAAVLKIEGSVSVRLCVILHPTPPWGVRWGSETEALAGRGEAFKVFVWRGDSSLAFHQAPRALPCSRSLPPTTYASQIWKHKGFFPPLF